MRRLVIIDVSNFIFRAFFAIRPLHAPDKTPVNAVYGVLTMFHRLITDLEPTHVACARDTKGPSFRSEKYEDYKANRSEPPDDLRPQFALVDELLARLHLPSIAMPRFEADDIIGSLVCQYRDSFDEILIASGDKDLMQFVDAKVKMIDTMKGKIYGPADVEEKMGVPPHQIVDYLSLVGDSSDNIPGVPGIGPKGAVALLKQFGTLEACLERADEVTAKKTQASLKENAKLARISKELALIDCTLKLPYAVDDLAFAFKADVELAQYLDRLGFKSFLSKIGTVADAVAVPVPKPSETKETLPVKTLSSAKELAGFLKTAKTCHVFPVFKEEDALFSPLEAIAFTGDAGSAVWMNPPEEVVWREMAQANIHWVSWELKPLWKRFLHLGLEPGDGDDLAQIHFLLSPEGRHDLDTLAREKSGHGLPELASECQGDLFEAKLKPEALLARTEFMHACYPDLIAELTTHLLDRPYRELDLPLIKVLARMELKGITLNVPFYGELEKEFAQETTGIEKEVEGLAGHAVNLKSPKQVAQMLFEEQSLPALKKTKTGFSTDVDVLEELAALGTNPIPGLLLRYRELDKLNSTYVKTLPKLIGADGRLHTTFRPGNAATGRLSSDSPNLQNIPVRTENGRRLRQGFVAAPGKVLLSADYSQVELRLLAHFAEDPVMLDAFAKDKDIHVQTAAEVFGIPLDKVTKDQRNSAKAINFGLMYGQTSFGLSQALRISQGAAKEYITAYFQRFGRVKGYLDSLKEFAEKHGYAETLFGRKRFLPDIHSQNRQTKAMAERMAINSPIQGTAADIIKLAMVNLDRELRAQKLKSTILLQVHDELILEVPPEEVDAVSALTRKYMEGAVSLRVPLRVDMGTGQNWYELK